MKQYIFTLTSIIPRPLDETFAFFCKAENLERITPAKLKFKILSPLPIRMQKGALIEYQIRLMGVPFRWKTEINLWQPPRSFRDIQLKGPYKKWEHTHHFEEKNGHTLMTDTVHYQLPFSVLGRIAHFLFVKKQIESIFEYRQQQILLIFGRDNS